MKKKIFVSLVFALMSAVAIANPWSYHGPKRDIVTLVVTANYEHPRLIAELIQDESRQPFLLLPVKNGDNLYFCPPKHLGKARVFKRQRLGKTLAFIAPKQIIVLGNEKYVPEDVVKELRMVAPVCIINAENWQQAADTVGPMLNLSKLSKSYRKLSAQLDSRLYLPDKNESKSSFIPEDKKDSDPDEPALNEPAPANDKKVAPAEYPAFDAENAKKAAPDKAEPAKEVKDNNTAEVAPLV